MKSKLIKSIIAAVAVIAVSVGGYFGYKTVFAKKATVASVQNITTTVKKMNLEVNVQGTGAAYAATTKEIMPNNNGTLSDLTVKVGDTVKAGQKLFKSSSDDLNTAVTTAQNSVTDANINLTSAQNDLAAKQKALADAQAAAAAGTTDNPNSQSSKSIDDYKLEVEKAKLTVEQNKLKVTNAKNNLTNAKSNVTKMSVTAPIGGLVTAVNNSNSDSAQAGKSVLTIVDMSSIKIKVSVDELDIQKIQLGQKAQIKFDAIKDKTYEGSVETIAQVGTTQNNVTTYDVVVAVANPEGIKLGMNANVTIQVESKENALVIPAEALVESNGKKYVRVESTDSSATGTETKPNNAEGVKTDAAAANPQTGNTQTPAANSGAQNTNGQTAGNAKGTRNTQGTRSPQSGNSTQTSAGSGKLIEIKTGMENENYIEVTEGLTEGQKVIITLPQTSATTTTNNRNNNMGGFGGGMPAGGGMPTTTRQRN